MSGGDEEFRGFLGWGHRYELIRKGPRELSRVMEIFYILTAESRYRSDCTDIYIFVRFIELYN